MRRQSWTWLLHFSRLLACLMVVTSLWGCATPITWQTIRAHNPGAERIDTCIRPPPFAGRGEFYTYNETTHDMVSDEDAEAFWEAARTAGTMYRYDPNAPSDPGPRLPWPYHRMTCDEVSSGDVPPLPKGMKEIVISHEMREAMVRALTAPGLRTRAAVDNAYKPSPELVGQVLLAPPQPEDYTTAIQELGQMLRDAARDKLPKVKRQGAGPSDADISIIDTKTGQIVGGLGAGFAIGSVPGGTFIAQGVMASGDKPTREFMLAEGFGEMASGGVQFGVGTGMAAGGGGLSLTGGGALVGVPTCTAGIALAANGTVTFINGGRKVIVALCHWNELPAAPSAAAANASGSTSAAAAASTAPTSGASGGAPVKPAATAAATPVPATKPAAPKTPKAEAPPPGTALVQIQPSGTITTTVRRPDRGKPPPKITTTITTKLDDAGQVQSITTTTEKVAPTQVGGSVKPKVADQPTTVYRSVDQATGQVQYVGITNDIARRGAEHLRQRGLPIERLITNLSRTDAKSVEQALIEIHGLEKNGGTLLNQINSIAKINPAYGQQLQHGYDLLKSIGYK